MSNPSTGDTWYSLNLSDLLPPEIPQTLALLTTTVTQFLSLYRQGLEVAKGYQALLDGGGIDVMHTVIQAIVDVVEGLLQAGRIHVLFIPIQKHFPSGNPPVTLPLTLTESAMELGFDPLEAGIVFKEGTNKAYSDLISPRGGNAAFYRTFAQSLSDPFDYNRPTYFSAGDAVVMAVLLLGSPSYSELVGAASAFNRIFRPQANANLTAQVLPVPKSLTAKVISLPKAKNMGVRLDWSPPQDFFSTPYFPGISVYVLRYAIIRTTDASVAMNAKTVLDFFSTQDLVEGMTSSDQAKVSKVIAVGNAINASYVDDDDSLNPDLHYYYCVAWEVAVNEHGAKIKLPFDTVSNIVKTRVRAVAPGTSTPPDWIAKGSALDLIPEIAVQIRTALEMIKALADKSSGGASKSVLTALNLIEKNINEFMTRLDALNTRLQRLTATVATPLPGLYSTVIAGTGGNTFLLSELASRLNNTSDLARPPYDADEYVMGICVVAGGPRMPDIQPIIDILNTLFQPTEASPLATVLSSLDDVVAAQEQATFAPNMAAYPLNADGTVQIPAGTMLPAGSPMPDGAIAPAEGYVVPVDGMAVDPATISRITGLPAISPKSVIADDGTPVDALDPKSPYVGDP